MSKLSDWKSYMQSRFGADMTHYDAALAKTIECANSSAGVGGGGLARMKAYFDCRIQKGKERRTT